MRRLALALLRAARAFVRWTHGDEVWITADGRVIPIRELDDAHLRNIRRMLLRDGDRPLDNLTIRIDAEAARRAPRTSRGAL